MTIYFDITDMLGYAIANPVCTGIQRGQLRIVGSAYDRGEDVGGFLKHPLTHKWRSADLSFLAGGYNYNREDFLSRFEINDTKELWLMKKTRKHTPGTLVHSFKWKYNEIRLKFSPKLKRRHWYLPNTKSCLGEINLNKTDILASIGTWGVDYDASFALAVENHCKTVTFVHDIFPMTDGRHRQDGFEPWIMFCATNHDMLICNSEYTKSELVKFLASRKIKADVRVTPYPHEFIPSQPINAKHGYALCVGTQAKRKNLPALVKNWKRVMDTLGTLAPELVIVGARTHEIHMLSNVSGMTFIEHPDDAALERLYQNCRFTVFPSREEGWGIPIGESLWFGKPVLCANSSSMPEVGGEYADYFDLADPDGLYNGILKMINSPRIIPIDIRSKLRTWGDTTSDMMSEIKTLQSAAPMEIEQKMAAE